MDLDAWLSVYDEICRAFGYDKAEDVRVADRLARRLPRRPLDRLTFADQSVAVVVGAALDRSGLARARQADRVVATGDALARLEAAAIPVSLAVTDLDSDPARVCRRTRTGRLAAVHAHGDNRRVIERWVPRMHRPNVVGTTQARPVGPLENFGGFTDGDRAAYLADGLGAASIDLVGWELGDETVGQTKRAKLAWAARLLTALETDRGERYDALDGHRAPL